MEVKNTSCTPLGYGEPPWIFKGSALYQLHLVKADTARPFIPKDCKLVEAFGYTLGGFFLASYDDSPAGIFDELVVIAGLVWNPPTSCAWAARVLVGSDEACLHGRKIVGLPSQVARFSKFNSPGQAYAKCLQIALFFLNKYSFSAILAMNFLFSSSFAHGFYYALYKGIPKKITALPRTPESKSSSFLSRIGLRTSSKCRNYMDVEVTEIKNQKAMSICNINFNATAIVVESDSGDGLTSYDARTLQKCQRVRVGFSKSSVVLGNPTGAASKVKSPRKLCISQQDSKGWMGPFIKMSLPNFSGRTKYNSNLLKYSCQIECRVRAVQPAKVLGPSSLDADKENSFEDQSSNVETVSRVPTGTKRNFSISVMLSKPILALEFNHLKMRVEAPTTVAACSQNTT